MPEQPTPSPPSSAPTPPAAPPIPPPAAPTFTTLAHLTEDLSQAVTCPICLEHMPDARQLQCGHLFCAECVTRMLAMEQVRCAVCKEKTGKRMVRPAPLDFAAIVADLHALAAVVRELDLPAPGTAAARLQDGFGPVLNPSLARLQSAQMQRNASPGAHALSEREASLGGTPVRKRCSLCPRGIDPVMFPDTVPFGPVMPAASSKKHRSLFVHESCALFSPEVYELEGVIQNVERAVRRSRKIVCGRDACGRYRANLACAAEDCDVSYHFPCAVVEKCVLVEDGYKIFCQAHKHLAPEIDDGDFRKNMSDPKDAATLEHEDCCYLCGTGGRLLMCDTCDRVTHPVCAGLKAIPEGDWSCGVCTGDHTALDAGEVDSGRDEKYKKSTQAGIKRGRAEAVDTPNDVEADIGNPVEAAKPSDRKKPRKSFEGGNRYVITNTGLNEAQKELLRGLSKTKRAILRSDMDRRATHLVISAYTKNETPGRTMKLCKAIAAKTPIVCWKWVEESAESETWAPIEPHLHPLSWPRENPPIFDGMRFFFGAYNGPTEKKDDLMRLIVLGGGSVINREPSIEMAPSNGTLMYVRDEAVKKGGRREVLSRFEPPTGTEVISPAWILDRCTKNRM